MNFLAFIQAGTGLETSFWALFALLLLQSAFVKTHQSCPCGLHKNCYSERTDGSGFCFSCNKNIKSETSQYRTDTVVKPASKPSPLRVMQDELIHRSQFGVPKSPFCNTCEQITGKKPQQFYYLGAFGNDVLFFYRDFERVVRNKKTVRYEKNGFNRRKDVHPYIEKGCFMPFWGEEHLEAFVNTHLTDIIFVESEKSAIYGQLTLKNFLWLGTSSSTGCTRHKIERIKHLLHGKRLFVMFDADEAGEKGAETAINNFARSGLSAKKLNITDIFSNAPAKSDIADAIVAAKGVTL